MEKLSFTVELDAAEKNELEEILGLPIPAAVRLFLDQVRVKGVSPFDAALPEAPDSVNADLMTDEELAQKLKRGFDDAKACRYRPARDVFAEFLESHGYEAL